MIPAIDLGLGLLEALLSKLKTNIPLDVVEAIQAAYDALEAHKADLVTKANLDAQRG